MSIPHIGTREWIRSFYMTLMDAWRAWFVDAQVAGLVLNFAKMMHFIPFVLNFEICTISPKSVTYTYLFQLDTPRSIQKMTMF